MQQGEPLTFVMEDEPVTVGIDLNEKNGIRFCQGDSQKWIGQAKREWDKYTFGCYGCWVMGDDSAVMDAGSWAMTGVLTIYLKNSTPKNSGTSRRKVPNAIWAQAFTSNQS